MDKNKLLEKISNYINDNEELSQKDFINYINKIWNEDKVKIKKEPSAYNLFIKEQMEIIKKEDPDKKDKMKYIAKLWNDKKEVKGRAPRKAL